MDKHHLHAGIVKALQSRDISAVHAWLAEGANPNWQPAEPDSETPMQVAAANDFVAGLEAMLAAGGNPNLPGKDLKTPLMCAASEGSVAAGFCLLRNGADAFTLVKQKFESEMSALKYATLSNGLEFSKMLIEECPQLKGNPLKEAASLALTHLTFEMANWLLESGVPASTTTRSGVPWMHTIQYDDKTSNSFTSLLLKFGADVDIQDANFGSTALHVAAAATQPRCLLRLLNTGANPDIQNRAGQTVRQLAKEGSRGPDIKSIFEAWEASHVAHAAIRHSLDSSGVRPL